MKALHPIIKLVLVLLAVFSLFFVLAILDSFFGWFGGGPGNPNIGLATLGFFTMFIIVLGFVIVAMKRLFVYLFMRQKQKNKQ